MPSGAAHRRPLRPFRQTSALSSSSSSSTPWSLSSSSRSVVTKFTLIPIQLYAGCVTFVDAERKSTLNAIGTSYARSRALHTVSPQGDRRARTLEPRDERRGVARSLVGGRHALRAREKRKKRRGRRSRKRDENVRHEWTARLPTPLSLSRRTDVGRNRARTRVAIAPTSPVPVGVPNGTTTQSFNRGIAVEASSSRRSIVMTISMHVSLHVHAGNEEGETE